MKYRLSATILVATLVLGGCAQMRVNEGMQLYAADKAACEQGDLTRENAQKRLNCANEAFVRRLSEAGYAYMPLARKYTSENEIAAVDFAEGRISKAQYQAKLNSNWSNFEIAESQAIDAYKTRSAATWQAFSASMPTPQPVQPITTPAFRGPVMTNCRQLGSNFNCTTW